MSRFMLLTFAILAIGGLVIATGHVATVQDGVDTVIGVGSDLAQGAVDTAADATSTNEAELRMAIHERVNEERTRRGLPRLRYSTALEDVAQAHSDDMAEKGYFSHTSPSGVGLRQRYRRFGAPCGAGGENIFRSTSSPASEQSFAEETVDSWMGSPGHRENILRGRFRVEAIAIAEGDGYTYVTQNFC